MCSPSSTRIADMVRNRKQQLLTVVMLCVSGCTSSNFNGPKQPFAKSPQRRSTPVIVSDTTPPQILPSTHFAAGRMFEAHGQLDKAMVQYRKAIAVSHNHVPSYHHLGLLLSKLQKHDEAIVMLSKAVELQPNNAALRNNLGFELMFRQRWSEAAAHLRKAIDLEPRFARAQINLGMTLSKVGQFDDALAHFRAVLPEPDALYNLGLMYRAAQRYSDAADAFHRALERNPKFRAAQTQLADIAPHLTPKTQPTTEAAPPLPVLATETVETPIPVAVVPPCEPIQDMMTPDTSRQQVVTEAPAHAATTTVARTADVAEFQPAEPAYEYGAGDPFFAEEPIATFITNDVLAEFASDGTTNTIAAMSASEDVIDISEDPCNDEDQITAMIQTGTLPSAPVNMLNDESQWITDEAYEEEVNRFGDTLSMISSDIEPPYDPCEDEEYVEDDLIGLAITEMNAAILPLPADIPIPADTVATPQDEEMDRMPFGPLNDEVAQIDNEMRCLLEEALEAIAQAPDTPRGPLPFEPIATPSADESFLETLVTSNHEPADTTPLATVPPEVPVTHITTFAMNMPSTTRAQVAVIHAPPASIIAPAAVTEPLPLDWHSRMKNYERHHVAIRSELECLEQLDEELSSERVATAAVEPPRPQRDVMLVADRQPPEKPGPRIPRSRRSRRTRMTMAYEPTAAMPTLASAPTRPAARRRMPVVIHDADRTDAIPVLIARPDYESDIVADVEIGPAVPTQKRESAFAAKQTGRTSRTFNWSQQFGDLEDMISVTYNEIRCFDDMAQTTDLDLMMDQQEHAPRSNHTRVTPVRYNGRRNPFYRNEAQRNR